MDINTNTKIDIKQDFAIDKSEEELDELEKGIDKIENNDSDEINDDFSISDDEEDEDNEDNLNLCNFQDNEIVNKIKDKLNTLPMNIIKKIIKVVFMMMMN